jgi:hypothetical protein
MKSHTGNGSVLISTYMRDTEADCFAPGRLLSLKYGDKEVRIHEATTYLVFVIFQVIFQTNRKDKPLFIYREIQWNRCSW